MGLFVMNSNVFIMGALPSNIMDRSVYEMMTGVCREYAETVNSMIDAADFERGGGDPIRRCHDYIAEANVVVSRQSGVVFMQGLDLPYVDKLGKPIIVCAEGARMIENFENFDNVVDVVRCQNISDSSDGLRTVLGKLEWASF